MHIFSIYETMPPFESMSFSNNSFSKKFLKKKCCIKCIGYHYSNKYDTLLAKDCTSFGWGENGRDGEVEEKMREKMLFSLVWIKRENRGGRKQKRNPMDL